MNENIMRSAGFIEELTTVRNGNCPMCKKIIHPNKEFRDSLSNKEFKISGLCQTCQDKIFKEE